MRPRRGHRNRPLPGRRARRAEAERQFAGFFRAFRDYRVRADYLRTAGDLVVGAGTISATMRGALAGIEPTGKSFELPFACH
ncbi:ester cyclase [Amycolatopsis methanolica]